MNLKQFIGIAVFVVFAFALKMIVLSSHKNEVNHFAAVVHPGYESSPEYYEVSPSPAKTWELTNHGGSKAFRIVGAVAFWVLVAFLVLSVSNKILIAKGSVAIAVGLALLWLSFTYASYSSATGNYVRITPEQYNEMKAKPKGTFDLLFEQKKVDGTWQK